MTITEELFIYFATHCSINLGLAYTTIKLYLCGIRNVYIELGKGDPFMIGNKPMLKLQLLLKGIKKAKRQPTLTRLPITGDLLHAMCIMLSHSLFGQYLDTLMRAAITMAFYGFLRCGEFTSLTSNFDASCGLARGDISVISGGQSTPGISILLKASKTDPFRSGTIINIFQTGGITCPVNALNRFITLRHSFSVDPEGPLFLLPSGRPLSRALFLDMLAQLCTSLGLDPKSYHGHSFRIGAATTAAKLNVPDYLIQQLGRWTSTCYQVYIRTDDETLKNTHLLMARGCSPSNMD